MLFSIRIFAPVLLILFALLTSVYTLVHDIPQALSIAEKDAKEDLAQLMNRTQGALATSYRSGDAQRFPRDEISRLGSVPEVKAALLLDEQKRVVASTRYEHLGLNMASLSIDIEESIVLDVQKSMIGRTEWESGKNALIAVYPIMMGTDEEGIRPNRVGILLVEYDVKKKRDLAKEGVFNEVLHFALLSFGLAILLATFFHFTFTRRVESIVKQVQLFRAGQMGARIDIGGGDELSNIADAFNSMAMKIEHDQTDLQDREARLQAIVDNAGDAIITIDHRGFIQSFNPASEKMFRYNSLEVIGRNVSCLMSEPYHSAHQGYIDHYIESGEKKIIGIGREVEAKRKSGEVFPIDLQVTQVLHEDGPIFVGLIRDITERRKIDQMKSEFISTVSHELRTPLTSIQGSLGLLTGGVVGELSDKAKSMLKIAHSNSERLIRLINDILDIEKIESGKMAFNLGLFSVASLLSDAIEANHGYAEKHNVSLDLKVPDEGGEVFVDHDRFMQVMANLISNAVKYSPGEGVVEVAGEVIEKSFVRITVRDHGNGIPEEFREKIFSKFSQADSSDTRKMGGTGLGLSIARAIVEKHGGEIGYDSQSGIGTTFFIKLPTMSGVTRGDEDRASSLKILLVSESHTDSTNFQNKLTSEGIESLREDNLEQVVPHLLEGSCSMLLVDLLSVGSSLGRLVSSIKEHSELSQFPIVLLSRKSKDDLSMQGLPLDLIDWIENSTDIQRLVEAIRARLTGQDKKRSVLHVEDDTDVTEVVSNILEPEMMEYQVASSVESAKQLVQEADFDLVILDIALPDGNGIDLLPELKDRSGNPIPVIIFSAYDVEPEVINRVDATLVKSRTDNEQLLNIIQAILKR